MNTTQIILSPNLGISPDEFAASWNATPDCRETAVASVGAPSAAAQQFDPLLDLAGVVLVGIATNAAYDVIKTLVLKALQKKTPQTHAQVQVLLQSDGSLWVVVHADNE